jgi:hypothetical protein
LSQTIYDLVIQEFKTIRDVSDDGIYVIIGLISRIKQNFVKYIPDFYNYIKHAFEKIHEKDVFKAALNLVLEIC